MKKRIVVMFAVWLFTTCNLLGVKAQQVRDYVVVTSKKVQADGEWMKVVEALAKRHKAARIVGGVTAFNSPLRGSGGKTGKPQSGVCHGRASFESGNR